MCLISFALGLHHCYRLVLVAHRDEFFKRPSSPMHWWRGDSSNEGQPVFLAGKDELGGGTWFGINERGMWAAVTNYREPHPDRDVLTRGELVTDFLESDLAAPDYLNLVAKKSTLYNGFNLLVGRLDEVFWFCNRQPGSAVVQAPLSKGIYGLSNHLLDTAWPKVEMAKRCLAERLKSDLLSPDELVLTLHDESRPADELLPATGVDLSAERMLSSMFINDSATEYGTRCSTALTISNEGEIAVAELTYPEKSSVTYFFKVD